jgi:hypothetical protein
MNIVNGSYVTFGLWTHYYLLKFLVFKSILNNSIMYQNAL